MYLFYDNTGTLKEIINDLPARVGNENWNKIYAYIDTTAVLTSGVIKYRLPNGTSTAELSGTWKTDQQIPFDKNRDLKFFEYYKNYNMYEFTVPSNVLALTGAVGFNIKVTTATQVIALGESAFMVSGGSSFLPDEYISIAQWNELLLRIANIDTSSYVTIATAQTITGNKNFTGNLKKNGVDVATVEDVPPTPTNMVTTDTEQTITGKKTFTDDIYSGLVTIYQDRIEIDGDEVAVADDLTNFITKSVNDLTNYYLKSETYTKQEVQAIISAIEKIEFVVASALPEASESTLNKIYLIPSTSSQTQNVKDEFITIRSGVEGSYTYAWEQIGSTSVDLSNYYTKAQTDALVNAKSVVSGTNDGTNWLTLNVNGTNKAIPQGSANAVLYTEQTLTDNQKQQARTNIGASGVDIVDWS